MYSDEIQSLKEKLGKSENTLKYYKYLVEDYQKRITNLAIKLEDITTSHKDEEAAHIELLNRLQEKMTKHETVIEEFGNLYKKYEDCFCSSTDHDIEEQSDYSDEMDSMMLKVCDSVGHDKLVPDHCGKPEHDFCIRCSTNREIIEKTKSFFGD